MRSRSRLSRPGPPAVSVPDRRLPIAAENTRARAIGTRHGEPPIVQKFASKAGRSVVRRTDRGTGSRACRDSATAAEPCTQWDTPSRNLRCEIVSDGDGPMGPIGREMNLKLDLILRIETHWKRNKLETRSDPLDETRSDPLETPWTTFLKCVKGGRHQGRRSGP